MNKNTMLLFFDISKTGKHAEPFKGFWSSLIKFIPKDAYMVFYLPFI